MSLKRNVLILALGAGALWSVPASAQTIGGSPSMTAGPTERQEMKPNRPLLFTGIGVIAASYIPPVIVAATSDHKGDNDLYIPIAGPWIDLGDRGGCGSNSCGTEAVYKTLLVVTGIAHLVGTGLIVSSLFIPEERNRQMSHATNAMKPMVVPTSVGRGGAGFSLVGSF